MDIVVVFDRQQAEAVVVAFVVVLGERCCSPPHQKHLHCPRRRRRLCRLVLVARGLFELVGTADDVMGPRRRIVEVRRVGWAPGDAGG
jgi:hypothetical protein